MERNLMEVFQSNDLLDERSKVNKVWFVRLAQVLPVKTVPKLKITASLGDIFHVVLLNMLGTLIQC